MFKKAAVLFSVLFTLDLSATWADVTVSDSKLMKNLFRETNLDALRGIIFDGISVNGEKCQIYLSKQAAKGLVNADFGENGANRFKTFPSNVIQNEVSFIDTLPGPYDNYTVITTLDEDTDEIFKSHKDSLGDGIRHIRVTNKGALPFEEAIKVGSLDIKMNTSIKMKNSLDEWEINIINCKISSVKTLTIKE